jgi:hypothetical protein
MRAPMVSISARTCSMVTPGFIRPIAMSQWKLRVNFVGSNQSGTQICAQVRSVGAPSGSTPMIE